MKCIEPVDGFVILPVRGVFAYVAVEGGWITYRRLT